LGHDFFRPLPLILWYALTKLSASAWILHFANVTLHGIVAGLTGILALRMGWGLFWSLLAAMWLVVQPSAVEAVAWASGVQDVLMTACVVGALVLAAPGALFRPVAFVALIVAALVSKETAIAAPVLLGVFWMGDSRSLARRQWFCVLLAAGIVGIYLTVRFTVATLPDDYTRVPSRYFIKELIVQPFATLAVPWHEHDIARHSTLGMGSALVPLVLLLRGVGRGRADVLRGVLRLATWPLVAVGPVYAYFFISPHLEGSRYLYLATPAWVLLLTALLRSAGGARPSWPSAVAAAALIMLSAFGVGQNLRPWIAAGEMRDVVLREARATTVAADCRTVVFEGVPDSLDGAYIFRNGFDIAVGELPTSPSGLDCRFRWDGGRFVRRDAERNRN